MPEALETTLEMQRPQPPEMLGEFVHDYPVNVMPALDMPAWVSKTFLTPDTKLYNLDHEIDNDGEPKFNRTTDNPLLAIQGHDVEEFTGVVRRYGPAHGVSEIVEVANQVPEVAVEDVRGACN